MHGKKTFLDEVMARKAIKQSGAARNVSANSHSDLPLMVFVYGIYGN